jgi:hypothetical protein
LQPRCVLVSLKKCNISGFSGFNSILKKKVSATFWKKLPCLRAVADQTKPSQRQRCSAFNPVMPFRRTRPASNHQWTLHSKSATSISKTLCFAARLAPLSHLHTHRPLLPDTLHSSSGCSCSSLFRSERQVRICVWRSPCNFLLIYHRSFTSKFIDAMTLFKRQARWHSINHHHAPSSSTKCPQLPECAHVITQSCRTCHPKAPSRFPPCSHTTPSTLAIRHIHAGFAPGL